MDTAIIEAQNRIRSKRTQSLCGQIDKKKNSNYISNLFTRTLISVILVLACAIFVNLNDKNLLFFKNNLFNETLAFTKINELYKKYFGDIVPDIDNKNIMPVFNNDKPFKSIEAIGNSYKGLMNTNVISFLESGIVVFAGEKDGYGKTVIVQGIDGVDIWYSNLNELNITMYDYVEKGNILGEIKDNEVVLTFMENGEFTGYEKYINQN